MIENIKKEKRNSLFLSYMLCFTGIVTSIMVIIHSLLPSLNINAVFLYLIYFILLFIFLFDYGIEYLKDFGKKISMTSFIFILFILLSIILTFLTYPQNREYMWTSITDVVENPLYIFIFYSIIGFFVARKINNVNILAEYLEIFSSFTIVLLSIRFLFGIFKIAELPEYMTFSYNLLFPTCYILLLHIKERKISRLILSIIGTALIIIQGCRGALFGLILMVVMYTFSWGKISKSKKIVIVILTFIFMIYSAVFYEPLLSYIVKWLSSIGLKSRTIEMSLSSTLLSDSGRGIYQKTVLSNMGIIGKGVWGDRVILEGSYAHNLFLELLYDYGIVIGTIVLIFMIYVVIKSIRIANEKMCIIICSLFSVGLIKLMFSGSFLNQEPALWVLLGFCTRIVFNSRELGLIRE